MTDKLTCDSDEPAADTGDIHRAPLMKEIDQLRVQLAGCSVVALGGSPEANKRDYGWSPAYEDIRSLWLKCERYRAALEKIKEGNHGGAYTLAKNIANEALNPEGIRHGTNCPKVPHKGGGYLHAADDDESYRVDGVDYCGRCHEALDEAGP